MSKEKISLEVYRLRNWIETAAGAWAELQGLQKKMQEIGVHAQHLTAHASMAILEADDQRRRLKELGVTDEELNTLAPMPEINLDPHSVLHQLEQIRGVIAAKNSKEKA